MSGRAREGARLAKTEFSPKKLTGASPAECRYYVLVLFDISGHKKYRLLTKELKKYATRVQKSVFEAQLRPAQIRQLCDAIERLMSQERYHDPDDNVRVYKIAGNCDVTVFGTCTSTLTEENIFI